MSQYDSLGVIHNPNLPGLACDFRPKSLPVLPGRASREGGLPNIPNYRLGPLAAQVADAGSADTICPGEAIQIGTADTSGTLVFDWFPIQGLSDAQTAQPMANPSVTTTYYLMVTDTTVHASCGTTEDSVTVYVVDTMGRPMANAGPDTLVCQGETLQLGATPQTGTFYQWQPSQGLDDPTTANPTTQAENSNTYYLTAYDLINGQQYACRTDQDSVFIAVEMPLQHPLPEGATFCPGEEMRIGVDPQDGFTYRWEPQTGLKTPFESWTRLVAEESQTRQLILTDTSKITEACRIRQDEVFLAADNCLLQNVLTPNGDGINDVLDLGDFHVPVGISIYDRWGNLVFEKAPYLNDWDGGNLPESTYYYRIHVTNTKGGDKVNYLDLIR